MAPSLSHPAITAARAESAEAPEEQAVRPEQAEKAVPVEVVATALEALEASTLAVRLDTPVLRRLQ